MKFRNWNLLIILILSLVFSINNSYGEEQNNVQKKKTALKRNITKKSTVRKTINTSTEKIVDDPDIDPMFTGGSYAMTNFITENMNYPQESLDRKKEGLVVWTFTVDTAGLLSDFDIIHRADSALDQEALRIIKLMPPWRPAKLNGKFVKAKTYVPMLFKLNNAKKRERTAVEQAIMHPETEKIYSEVEQMPQFPGGNDKLAVYLANNIEYPEQAKAEKIEGRVLTSFVVKKDGKVSDIQIIESVNPLLNEEAIRVLGLMPDWIPGEEKGEHVNVRCILPIDFKL